MSLGSQVVGFVRELFRTRSRPRHRGDAVARTAQDALGKRGNLGVGHNDRTVYRHVADGVDAYDASFDE